MARNFINKSMKTTLVTPALIRSNIQFHEKLNPKLWDSFDLMPDVRLKLLKSGISFYKFLEVPGLLILDIVITGSNAAYNYTPDSDIDVHLIADFNSASCPDLAENLFMSKKQLWTQTYSVEIKGFPVELYVENADSPATSNGVYSLVNNNWLKEPKKLVPPDNDSSVIRKTEFYASRINDLLASNPTASEISVLLKRIKLLRQSGLDRAGEYSTENLTFKSLRALGLIDKLWNVKDKKIEKGLSLAESEGHGHITPRKDGIKMRCGGPNICQMCQDEAAAKAKSI